MLPSNPGFPQIFGVVQHPGCAWSETEHFSCCGCGFVPAEEPQLGPWGMCEPEHTAGPFESSAGVSDGTRRAKQKFTFFSANSDPFAYRNTWAVAASSCLHNFPQPAVLQPHPCWAQVKNPAVEAKPAQKSPESRAGESSCEMEVETNAFFFFSWALLHSHKDIKKCSSILLFFF